MATTFTDTEQPDTSVTDVAQPTSGKEARFGIGKFSQARFGNPDSVTDVAEPASTFTDVAQP